MRHTITALALMAALAAQAQQTGTNPYEGSYDKFRVGGYGELAASFMGYGTNRYFGGSEGNTYERRNTISIPRFVLAGDYKFTRKWHLGVEIEFEAGGTGSAIELENSENGEYETEIEKGGEVALEQFHITRLICPEFNVRAGHIIVPVGLTNAHHEPVNFFGVYRPEGESRIIPSTWHETGLSVFGTIGHGTRYATEYQAMIVAGLNANGFDRTTWVAGGKQGLFERDNFTSPAYVLRVDYKGVKGLRVGASMYYCANTGANSDKAQTYSKVGRTPLRIYTADAQYSNRYVTARGNLLFGSLTNSLGISGANAKLSNKSPYSRTTPVAHHAVSYSAEVGLNLRGFIGKMPNIIPFVHYEYYNPQQAVEAPNTADLREQVSMWTTGINWRPVPNVVVKADWTTRVIGGHTTGLHSRYNRENECSVGVAFMGWFDPKK